VAIPKHSVVDTEVQEMDVTLAASIVARIDVGRETEPGITSSGRCGTTSPCATTGDRR
jgi:hypothetical protein